MHYKNNISSENCFTYNALSLHILGNELTQEEVDKILFVLHIFMNRPISMFDSPLVISLALHTLVYLGSHTLGSVTPAHRICRLCFPIIEL